MYQFDKHVWTFKDIKLTGPSRSICRDIRDSSESRLALKRADGIVVDMLQPMLEIVDCLTTRHNDATIWVIWPTLEGLVN